MRDRQLRNLTLWERAQVTEPWILRRRLEVTAKIRRIEAGATKYVITWFCPPGSLRSRFLDTRSAHNGMCTT